MFLFTVGGLTGVVLNMRPKGMYEALEGGIYVVSFIPADIASTIAQGHGAIRVLCTNKGHHPS